MTLLKRGRIRLLLKLTIALGSLSILSLLTRSEPGWNPSSVLRYSWLEYIDSDDSTEKVCNCSGILQGEREALEQAKLLTSEKDFHKSVHIPDEHYMNATEDCSAFKLRRKYLTSPLSQEEEDFPLAYSMVVHHKDTGKANEPPPINITIMYGSAYIVVSRGFIRSVLEDSRVPALMEWGKDTFIPDEMFWLCLLSGTSSSASHGQSWLLAARKRGGIRRTH
ncbi:beta-1,3-galactosyl-O-glycosyl-glycoprotein beta-1,6-N-acetylglucosaminyltransferase 3-like [Limanda limanda]|uniref:beta-1,3-galactosyl-O-glycosyl-glycoprotein beta-1,6-N-acetylglucosaminyltransferase 3-like n=1 Tax=Limanda limanda TaxID=27771 RepID=UPI0029C63CE2|nr:beta-1,3-galactosyl-O-glycosyl-glycoprotein beta-1,6-N-acetylglucosaminyltransferase 3-like [Limanda limanda]